MRHRLCGLSTYGLNGFEREMSTPPTLRRGTADFTFYSSPDNRAYNVTLFSLLEVATTIASTHCVWSGPEMDGQAELAWFARYQDSIPVSNHPSQY